MVVKLGITDDRKEIRENLARILGQFSDLEVVFVANDGEAAVRHIEGPAENPEVILMDIEMRKMGGTEATEKITALAPNVKIIMLTIFEQDEEIFKAIRAGAVGYLLKDERPAELHRAILDAQAGRMPMSPLIAGKALSFLRTMEPPVATKTTDDYGLSKREVEILEPLAAGKTYTEIASLLFISPKTVRTHMENIYRKLSVHSKVEASNLVAKNKWFDKLSMLF